ncbi:MAG: site-specific DNA-methyltransferase, partial [Thermovenabulum sp.]
TPRIKDASPVVDPKLIDFDKEKYYNVSEIISPDTVKLDSGLKVKFFFHRFKEKFLLLEGSDT